MVLETGSPTVRGCFRRQQKEQFTAAAVRDGAAATG